MDTKKNIGFILSKMHILTLRFVASIFLLIITTRGLAQVPIKIQITGDSIQKLSEWRIVGPFVHSLNHINQLDSLKLVTQRDGVILKDTFCNLKNERMNLDVLLSTRKKAVAYGKCQVFSEQDQDVLLFINVDDKMKVWINDDPAILVQKHTKNGAVPRKARVKKGINDIFIEITNNGRDWWFDVGLLGNKKALEILSSLRTNIPENIIRSSYAPRTQLTNWRVIGPFKYALDNIDYFDLIKARTYTDGQNIIDTNYHQGKPGNSLYSLFNTTDEKRTAYAICNVFSEKDQDLVLDLRVDDELRLWVNRKEILKSPADRIAIKKVHFKKGKNEVIAEIKNEYLDWWFEIAVSGMEYVRDNMLLPGYCLSAINSVISKGDSLMVSVADTSFIPVKKMSTIEIFDASSKMVYSAEIDISRQEKIPLLQFPVGAYRYRLYTDLDTLSEYFCYGSLDTIYRRDQLLDYRKKNPTAYSCLLPYIGRFDRLLNDYKKTPNTLLGKKIAHCIYKIKEIDIGAQKKSTAYLRNSGLSIRSFRSTIDYGDEHYLIYIPEKMMGSGAAIPLVVMVPFVTNTHPFYTGTIIANYERMTYVSKFADRYGFAVIFPSSRIYKWYNQTPIVTKSIVESIQNASRYYNLDRNRIFLYGECSGALFALQTAIRRPDLFASIAIRGPELSTVNLEDTKMSGKFANDIFSLADNLYGKPVLAFHSNLDHAARIDFTNRLVDSLKAIGGSVYYNNLPGLVKDYDMTSYSEPEVINATFSFFKNVRHSDFSDLRKIATYGFYNDTLYGIFVKEKLLPGKATVSYRIKAGKLELNTTNVRQVVIDTRKLGLENNKEIEIYHNGKKVPRDKAYRTEKNFIILTITSPTGKQKRDDLKEVKGPLNKVFLRTFAIVRPANATSKNDSLIAAVDSVWFNEYRNHILVVGEKSLVL